MWDVLQGSLASLNHDLCRLVFSFAVNTLEIIETRLGLSRAFQSQEAIFELWQLYKKQSSHNERTKQQFLLLSVLESPLVVMCLPMVLDLPASSNWREVHLNFETVQLPADLEPNEYDEIRDLLGKKMSQCNNLLLRAINIENWDLIEHLLETCAASEYALYALFVRRVVWDPFDSTLPTFLLQHFSTYCSLERARDKHSTRLCFHSDSLRREFFHQLRMHKLHTGDIRHRTKST